MTDRIAIANANANAEFTMTRTSSSSPTTSRNVVLIGYYGLILTLFFNSLSMTTGLAVTTFVIWLIQSLPLVLFLPGLHRYRIRSYAWLSFVVLMYFVHGVLTAFTPGRLLTGLAEVFFCCLLFVALIVYIRRNGARAKSDA